MIEKGIEPFACLPANLIVLMAEEKLNQPFELAQAKVEGESCRLLFVFFKKRPELMPKDNSRFDFKIKSRISN
jgi:hypothetical protein